MLTRVGLSSLRSSRASSKVMINRGMASNPSAGIPQALYNNLWRKSNVFYLTYIIAGCVAIELVYGGIMDSIWNGYNRGKLYHQVDWSKFKSEDEEEE